MTPHPDATPADRAARRQTTLDARFARLEHRLTVVTWMTAAALALTLVLVGKVFLTR